MDQAKRGSGTRGDEVLGLSRQDFYIFISLGMDWQFWLTVASCITADSFAHAFFIIQSVKIRCMYVFMNAWRRQWQPTPVLLPGKSYGRRSLVGYSPWGREESDTTYWLNNNNNSAGLTSPACISVMVCLMTNHLAWNIIQKQGSGTLRIGPKT